MTVLRPDPMVGRTYVDVTRFAFFVARWDIAPCDSSRSERPEESLSAVTSATSAATI